MSTAMMLILLMFSVQGSVCALMKVPFVTSARANAPSTMSRVDSSAWPIRCTTPGSSRRCDSPMCALSRGPMFSPMFSRARAVPQTDLLPRIPGSPSRNRKPVVKTPGYLTTGPILLSWIGAIVTLILQASLTDWAQLGLDAQATFGFLSNDPTLQRVAMYSCIFVSAFGWSAAVMPRLLPPKQSQPDADGKTVSLEVPLRSPSSMVQHPLNGIDASYMALNALCMPGLFYHFICLMRSFGLDFASPPMFGIYPESPFELVTQTLPELVVAVPLYMVSYEFVYYWWHRAMHVSPILYKWVHRHHHQQTYPDRGLVDTFNTCCIESQVGLYMQLGVLWAFDRGLGYSSLPGAIWFFSIAGLLSVLSHDNMDRALPFDLWRADEHHMHHAIAKCNYAPYTTLWDRVFGTYKEFEVKPVTAPRELLPEEAMAIAFLPVVAREREPEGSMALAPMRITVSDSATAAAVPPLAEREREIAISRESEIARLSERIWKAVHHRLGISDVAKEDAMGMKMSLAKEDAVGEDRDDLNDLMDRSADNGRLNGYCDEDDEACRLEDQLERSQLVDGDNMVKMRGLAWGSASIITTLLLLFAAMMISSESPAL